MAPFSKPETVLKQAEGLVAVGQTPAALQSLSEMFSSSKRFRSTPVTQLEPILIRFMELCVELRKGRLAKEGLMQYKNLAQNTNVASIEIVVGRFIEMAEGKVLEAKEKAREAALKEKLEGDTTATGGDVDDLEAPSTPESILLSSVSSTSTSSGGAASMDRTSRALITPSLKFLWESYRTSLETLKNNARLETIYQSVAQKAFKFCLSNNRKTEFRRLCETLRLHLANVGKYAAQQRELALAAAAAAASGGTAAAATAGAHHQINLGDPETLQRHLDTRFAQLNASVELELWQEAFRSIEDIHNLLTMAGSMPQVVGIGNAIVGTVLTATTTTTAAVSANTAGVSGTTGTTTTNTISGSVSTSSSLTIKSTMMANYYEKLSRVFLMSGNALYHAAAWARYYNLVTYAGAKTVGTGESKEVLAGKVIVSALAVPVSKGANGGSSSHPRLSALLNLPFPTSSSQSATSSSSPTTPPPSRSALLQSALSRDVLRLAPETVQKLYHALEVEFDPLTLCESVAPLLRELGGNDEGGDNEGKDSNAYAPYLPLLHEALLSRLLTHLSEVYSSIKIDFLTQLMAPLNALNNKISSSSEEGGGMNTSGSFNGVFTPASIESYIMSCARRGDLDVRIDHSEGSIVFIDEPFAMNTSSSSPSFDSQGAQSTSGSGMADVSGSEEAPVQPSATTLVRTRLSGVAACLYHSLKELEIKELVLPDSTTEISQDQNLQNLLASLPTYRKKLLLNQSLTARRRQLQQELHARAQAQNLTMQAEASRRAKEQARLLSLVEAREREAARRKAELEQIRRVEAEKYAKGLLEGGMGGILKGMGKEGREAVEKLTSSTSPIDTTSLIKMQVLALERDKSLRSSRLKTIAKRIDHLERAYRVSEMPLLEEDLKVQQGVDKEVWIQRGVELREEGKRRWEEEKEMKERLGRMRGVWEERKSTLLKRKGEEFALRREKAQRKIETEKAKRLDEFLKRQAEARATAEREAARVAQIAAEEQALLERQEEERLRKEAEEQELREKEEQERTDKEESEKAEKEREEREKEEKRKEREKERQKANEQARLQMEREEEAENRRAQRALERAQEKEREKELARGPERKSIFGNAQPVSTSTNGDGPAAATEVWRRRAAADSTPSGTPASSVPGTPTRSHGFGGTRSSAAVDVLTRSESPTPAAGAETGVGMASAKFRAGGWRARAEARKKGEELPPTGAPTPTSAAATTGTGGGIGSNTPSRTASPAPGPEDDGFTVVGGEKKNVWKPKAWRGGSGLRGR